MDEESLRQLYLTGYNPLTKFLLRKIYLQIHNNNVPMKFTFKIETLH